MLTRILILYQFSVFFYLFVVLVPKHDTRHNKLNSAIQEVSNYYSMLEEREKQALRSAMIEERSRFCTLFTLLKPVMVNRIKKKTIEVHSIVVSDCFSILSRKRKKRVEGKNK